MVRIVASAKNKALALVSHELDRGLRYDLWIVTMSNDPLLVGDDPLTLEPALDIRLPQRPLRVPAAFQLYGAKFDLAVLVRHDSSPLNFPKEPIPLIPNRDVFVKNTCHSKCFRFLKNHSELKRVNASANKTR